MKTQELLLRGRKQTTRVVFQFVFPAVSGLDKRLSAEVSHVAPPATALEKRKSTEV
jgi:hypothetical protein